MSNALMHDGTNVLMHNSSSSPEHADRYPHVPAHCRAGLAAAHAGLPLAHLTDQTRPAFAASVCERYLDGEEICDIAAQYGVTRHRLYQILLAGDADAWRSAQAARALAAYQDTMEEMRVAPDALYEVHKN